MGHVFISPIEKDAAALKQIVQGLQAAGYPTWCFERDVLPGTRHLIQTARAIEQCEAIVLIASPNALTSDQVTGEVVGASEKRKPFFPVLVDITPPELKERQPEWRHALGGTAMTCIGTRQVSDCIAHVIEGLKAQGVEPDGVPKRMAEAVSAMPRPTPNPSLTRSPLPGLPWRENARW
jgi:hypothetical protein